MVHHRGLAHPHIDLRHSLLGVLITASSVTACGSVHRVPITAPVPVASPAPAAPMPEVPPVASRDAPPPTFVNSNSDARTTRTIIVRDGLSNEALFRIAAEYLKSKYTVEVRDPSAGFLMTHWEAPVVRDGAPELRYRTRIIVRFFGEEYWKQLTVTSEANWLRGDQWQVGFDAPMLDSVSAQLASRLGKRI